MTSQLRNNQCVPCKAGGKPLDKKAAEAYLKELDSDWKIGKHGLEKEFRFKNFKEALTFTNDIGTLAEDEGHHPDIFLTWGKVNVQLITHVVGGLTPNDFIMADKIEALWAARVG